MIQSNHAGKGWRNFWGALLLVWMLPAFTWSQASRQTGKPEPQPADNLPRVNVGVSTAKPGDIIDIPITLSASDTVNANSIVETVSFPKKVLSLTKTELGLAGEQSQAEITADAKENGADPDQTDVLIRISSKELLKPGILAYLKFKVSPEATKGVVLLKIMDTKVTGPAGAVEVAKGRDGEVTIFNRNEEIPVVGCFFFSH